MNPLRALLDRRERAVLMGILNRTPDSFSDGGRFVDDGAALAHVQAMLREGAAVIDVGAESTRPGAPPIGEAEQIARLGNIVALVAERAIVSIDTTLPAVADKALADGASVINSVSLEPAAELARVAKSHGAALVLMHSRGAMMSMPGFSAYGDDAYGDVVADVLREWSEAADRALAAGLPRESLLFDPGFGFHKNARHSLELCARLDELVALGFPVLVGTSRKSFITRVAGDDPPAPPGERLGGSLAAAIACVERGAAIVRTHDVAETRQALAVAGALRRADREATQAHKRGPEGKWRSAHG
jgi:dihydropteroate synthase